MNNNNSLGKAGYIIGKILAVFLVVSILFGVVKVIFSIGNSIFDKHESKKDSHTSQQYIDSLDGSCLVAELKTTNVTIKAGDKFAYKTNNKNIKVKQTNGNIVINEAKILSSGNYKLEIIIPSDKQFSTVDFSMGAGDVTIDGISARNLDFEIGAGNATIDNLVVTGNAEFDCGAGDFSINGGVINDLEINSGVGEINVFATLTGDNEINSGIGEVNVCVAGDKSNYSIVVSKGAGDVKVDGATVSRDTTIGNGANEIEINGGLGEVDVSFAQEEKLER